MPPFFGAQACFPDRFVTPLPSSSFARLAFRPLPFKAANGAARRRGELDDEEGRAKPKIRWRAEEQPRRRREKKEDCETSADAAGDAGGADTAIAEAPGKSYYFVGARLRAVLIPSFIIEAFGEGGQTVVAPMFGPEFAIRRDGFEYNFALSYTAYPMDRTPFKSRRSAPAMELVRAHQVL